MAGVPEQSKYLAEVKLKLVNLSRRFQQCVCFSEPEQQ